MKKHFVLDENVIRLAQVLEDEHGEPSPVCLELILEIDRNCHALVLPWLVWPLYVRKARGLPQTRPATPRVIAIIDAMLRNSDKNHQFLIEEDLSEVSDLSAHVKEGDRIFVRAAATVAGSLLATTDRRLIAVLAEHEIDTANDFRAVPPQEALSVARTES